MAFTTYDQIRLKGLGGHPRAGKYDGCRGVVVETSRKYSSRGMFTVLVLPSDGGNAKRLTLNTKYLAPYSPSETMEGPPSVIFEGVTAACARYRVFGGGLMNSAAKDLDPEKESWDDLDHAQQLELIKEKGGNDWSNWATVAVPFFQELVADQVLVGENGFIDKLEESWNGGSVKALRQTYAVAKARSDRFDTYQLPDLVDGFDNLSPTEKFQTIMQNARDMDRAARNASRARSNVEEGFAQMMQGSGINMLWYYLKNLQPKQGAFSFGL